jgi:hypothetical protein
LNKGLALSEGSHPEFGGIGKVLLLKLYKIPKNLTQLLSINVEYRRCVDLNLLNEINQTENLKGFAFLKPNDQLRVKRALETKTVNVSQDPKNKGSLAFPFLNVFLFDCLSHTELFTAWRNHPG